MRELETSFGQVSTEESEAKFRICRGYAADAFARTAVSPTPLLRDATASEEFLIKDPNFIPYSKKSLSMRAARKPALNECEELEKEMFREMYRRKVCRRNGTNKRRGNGTFYFLNFKLYEVRTRVTIAISCFC